MYDIIANTDAGCRLDKDWLRNLVSPFEKDLSVDVVSGFYLPKTRNTFGQAVSVFTCPRWEEINAENFLPSARSIAFKKKVWRRIGGFPEWLRLTAEDTLFDLNLKKEGFKFHFASNAVVYWEPTRTLLSFFKKMYLYGRGDGEARLFPRRYSRTILKYVLGFILLLLGFKMSVWWWILGVALLTYFARMEIKSYQSSKNAKVLFFVPFLLIIADVGRVTGYIAGILKRQRKRALYV